MKFKVLRVWGNHNPAGITFNPGYYALAACLLSDMSVEEAIAKIILGKDVSEEFRPQKKTNKRAEICNAYLQGVTDYQELADMFDTDKRYVWMALTDKGVVKKKDHFFKLSDLMEHEPQLSQKEVAQRLGCGLSTVSRLMRKWYKQQGMGYFG